MPKKVVVAGIGTDIGKTVISSLLVKACGGEYWKPVQTGPWSDKDIVRGLVGDNFRLHDEAYSLQMPASPHQAAEAEGLTLEEPIPPEHEKTLFIEPCGGIMVPFRNDLLFIDIAKKWEAEWVIVVRDYLGSINHTLLTWKVLEDLNLPVRGFIFTGEANSSSRKAILKRSGVPLLFEVPQSSTLNHDQITLWAQVYKNQIPSDWIS